MTSATDVQILRGWLGGPPDRRWLHDCIEIAAQRFERVFLAIDLLTRAETDAQEYRDRRTPAVYRVTEKEGQHWAAGTTRN